jgi:hypothetical protein
LVYLPSLYCSVQHVLGAWGKLWIVKSWWA